MLSVELDIYSGRPNPTWILSPKEERELVDRIVANRSLMAPMSMAPDNLGYRGFIVTAVSEDQGAWHKAKLPSTFRIGGAYDQEQVAAMWLLDTSDKPNTEVDDYLRGVVQQPVPELAPSGAETTPEEQTDADVESQGSLMTCYSNYLTSATNFSFWNGAAYMPYNNCYNFASNYRSNTFAQPGRRSGRPYTSLTTASFRTALYYDGWWEACMGGSARNLTICLVIWPNRDFHFYRRSYGGIWCHKPGQTPARNTDNSGRLIYNPATANRGGYTVLCGYWYGNTSVPVV